MGLLRQLAKHVLTAIVSPERLLVRGPRSAPGERPRVALTFDDGPHAVHTPVLLDALAAYGVVGTFFVVGRDAEQHPDLVCRIASEGHEIGNHTWSHGEPSRTSPGEFLDEVKRTDELIERLTGKAPAAVRPPKGELNWRKLNGLWKQAKTVALWNVDPRDYRMQSAEEMSTWCRNYLALDGDVLLFHDNHPWALTAIRELASEKVFEQFQCVDISTLAGTTKDRVVASDSSIRFCTKTGPDTQPQGDRQRINLNGNGSDPVLVQSPSIPMGAN